MTVQVVATSDVGTLIAHELEGKYFVLTMNGARQVEFGDWLMGEFHGGDQLVYSVYNLTKKKAVKICLEAWECSLVEAVAAILSLEQVRFVDAGGARFMADSEGVANKLCNHIRHL